MNTPIADIDRAFIRFRDHGDPGALGQVFDSTAGELLNLARHLCGDSHAAEDLLQATFLSAIDSAPRFESNHRVTPWLVGILTNQVRNHRRKVKRAASTNADGIDGIATDLTGPASSAANREFRSACEASIRELPKAYTEVVRLTVDEGMRPAEIAERLGRPAGTVRSQVTRGMSLLREALPVAALPVVVAATSGRGTAAIRSVVMDHAKTSPFVVAAAGVNASWIIKLAVAILVLGLGSLGVLMFADDAGKLNSSPLDSTAVALAAERASTKPLSDETTRTALEGGMSDQGSSTDPRNTVPEDTVRILGRCLDGKGEGLPGITIEDLSFDPTQLTHKRDWLAQTDREGQFDFKVASNVSRDRRISFRSSVHATQIAALPARALNEHNGKELNLGDIQLKNAVLVTGRLLGAKSPQNTTFIGMTSKDESQGQIRNGIEINLFEELATHARADGTFEFEDRLLPGKYRLRVPGSTSCDPSEIIIPDDVTGFEIKAKVTWFPSVAPITGVVVDQDGNPVAHARVSARVTAQFDSAKVCATTLTDAAGRFSIDHGDPKAKGFALMARAPSLIRSHLIVNWGDSDLKVELSKPDSLTLRVTDSITGASIDRYGLLIEAPATHHHVYLGSDRAPLIHDGEHEFGLLEIEQLSADPARVLIVPMDKDHAPKVINLPEHASGHQEVQLDRLASCEVVVTTEDGERISGAKVSRLQVFGNADPQIEMPSKLETAIQVIDAVGIVAAGTSDARGRVDLRTAASRDCTIAVLKSGRSRFVVTGVQLSPNKTCHIVLPSAGVITGSLTGKTFLRRLRRVDQHGIPLYSPDTWTTGATVIWTDAGEDTPIFWDKKILKAKVNENGQFELKCPPRPGVLWMSQGFMSRSIGQAFPARKISSVITVASGERHSFEFNANAMALAAIEVTATLNGAIAVPDRINSYSISTRSSQQAERWPTGSGLTEGRTLLVVEPGRYDLFNFTHSEAKYYANGGSSYTQAGSVVLSAPAVVLRPGEVGAIDLEFHSASLELRVVDAQKKPLKDAWIQIKTADGAGHLEYRVGADGRWKIPMFTPGPCVFSVSAGGYGSFEEVERRTLAPGDNQPIQLLSRH